LPDLLGGEEEDELTAGLGEVPQELLEELLLGSSHDSAYTGDKDEPAGGEPGTLPLRCLDSSHVVGCARCKAAPGVESAGSFALVGDAGKVRPCGWCDRPTAQA